MSDSNLKTNIDQPTSGMATTSIIESFRKSAQGYLNDDRFSDFTIVCEGKEFKVHRCFICAHSKWFERCCSDMFSEASAQKVELKDDLPEAVERMIHFFCTWDYDDNISVDSVPNIADPKPVTALQMNAYIFAVAEKYEIPTLKALALEKFKKAAANLQGNIESQLQRATYTVFNHILLPESEEILKTTIVSLWVVGGEALTRQMPAASVQELFNDVPTFGFRLSMRLMAGRSHQLSQCCKHCKRGQSYARKTIATVVFRCFHCGGTEADEDVIDTSQTIVKKYW